MLKYPASKLLNQHLNNKSINQLWVSYTSLTYCWHFFEIFYICIFKLYSLYIVTNLNITLFSSNIIVCQVLGHKRKNFFSGKFPVALSQGNHPQMIKMSFILPRFNDTNEFGTHLFSKKPKESVVVILNNYNLNCFCL